MAELNFADRKDRQQIELGFEFAPDFNEDGLIPSITVDDSTGEVLMFAWMNREALIQTIKTRKATYFSRSRNSLWVKGETSGRVQHVKDLLVDCDQDVLQLRVEVEKQGACHRGYRSCFYRKVSDEDPGRLMFVEQEPVYDPGEQKGR